MKRVVLTSESVAIPPEVQDVPGEIQTFPSFWFCVYLTVPANSIFPMYMYTELMQQHIMVAEEKE